MSSEEELSKLLWLSCNVSTVRVGVFFSLESEHAFACLSTTARLHHPLRFVTVDHCHRHSTQHTVNAPLGVVRSHPQLSMPRSHVLSCVQCLPGTFLHETTACDQGHTTHLSWHLAVVNFACRCLDLGFRVDPLTQKIRDIHSRTGSAQLHRVSASVFMRSRVRVCE
jgi:hypothetical protein